jgi:galactitol-specific phosphotransferase system IIB component
MCGAGVGSSLLVVMGIQSVLKKNGYDERDFQFEQADVQSGRGLAQFADILVTTPAFVDSVEKDGPPAVFIKNLFSEAEIEEKFIPVLKKVLANKKD